MTTKKTKPFYFTFGYGQPNFPGYVLIHGLNEQDARERMVMKHGTNWAFMYTKFSDLHINDRIEVK